MQSLGGRPAAECFEDATLRARRLVFPAHDEANSALKGKRENQITKDTVRMLQKIVVVQRAAGDAGEKAYAPVLAPGKV